MRALTVEQTATPLSSGTVEANEEKNEPIEWNEDKKENKDGAPRHLTRA